MAPSGKFVYGSNRGHHSIAIFAINEATGRLTLVGHESSQGETPRNFNLDPTGSLLLAANQDTDTIVAFRVDAATGRLQATGAGDGRSRAGLHRVWRRVSRRVVLAPLWSPRPDGGTARRRVCRRTGRSSGGVPSPVGTGEG